MKNRAIVDNESSLNRIRNTIIKSTASLPLSDINGKNPSMRLKERIDEPQNGTIGPVFSRGYSEAELHALANNSFFSAYLNNKLAIFLMWMQKPLNPKPISEQERQRLICFLFDLQHHFMPPALQHKYRRIYQWLRICVTKFPNVKLKHRLTAIKMCERLYKAFGLELKFDGPGWRETVVHVIKKQMTMNSQDLLSKVGEEN